MWCKTFAYFLEVQPCLFLLVSSHSQTRNFLSEHLNIIIKQQLCGEGLPSLLPLHQADVFQQKQGILQQIIYAHQTSQKKLASGLVIQIISPSLERKYHHTGTESLYPLCGEKISWAPTLAGVSYQFGFVPFPIFLECKISGSSVFFYFFPMKFHIIM